MKETNRIDDFFKRRLSEEEAALPAEGWNAIKSKLAAEQGGVVTPNSNVFGNKRIILAMCLLLLCLGTTVWYAVKLKSENIVLATKLNSQNNKAGGNNLNLITKSTTALAKADFEENQLPDLKKSKNPSLTKENSIADLNSFSKSKDNSDLLKLNSKNIYVKTVQTINSKENGNRQRNEKSTNNNPNNKKNSNQNFGYSETNTGQKKSLKNKNMNYKIRSNHYSVLAKLAINNNKKISKTDRKSVV